MYNATITGERIKELRGSLSQDKCAQELGISRGALSFYENGDRKPDAEILHKMCKYFSVSADYLLGLSNNKTTDPDIDNACKVTGLSEQAIEKMMFINNLKCGKVFTAEGEKKILTQKEEIETATAKIENLFKQNEGLREQFQSFLDSLPREDKVELPQDLKEAFSEHTTITFAQEELEMRLDDEKNKGVLYIDTLNTVLSSMYFDDFISDLSIYRITDFSKSNKKIWSVSANANDKKDSAFIFDTKLIEHGLLSKIQQFIMSLKEEIPRNTLVDIEEFNRNGDED